MTGYGKLINRIRMDSSYKLFRPVWIRVLYSQKPIVRDYSNVASICDTLKKYINKSDRLKCSFV